MSGQSAKNEREDQVLESFVNMLEAAGLQARLVEHPDQIVPVTDRTFPDISSDGLLVLRPQGTETDEWWACDVMWPASPYADLAILETLHRLLDKLVQDQGLQLFIEAAFPANSADEPLKDVQSRSISAITEFAKAVAVAVRGTKTGTHQADGFTANWRPTLGEPILEMIVAAPTPSPLLSDQLTATLRESLVSKATNQGRRAKEAGCHPAVLIDIDGGGNVKQGTHWLPEMPFTYRAAVEAVLQDVESSLQAVLLLDRQGQWHLLSGEFPGLAPAASAPQVTFP